MQCLLCNQKLTTRENLKDHYINSHKVNKNNSFFKKLIDQKKKNVMYRRNCNYCDEFVFVNKARHDFLKHYMIGSGSGNDENDDRVRPLNVSGNDENDDRVRLLNVTSLGVIRKFEITFKEHSSYYDFFDSVAVVDEFLAEIKNYVFRYNNDVLIRAGFSIENIQQALSDYSIPLVQTRYWSTEPLLTKSFNDFISFKLRESILKRVVNNRLSGSAWNFNKFNYLNVKIVDASSALII